LKARSAKLHHAAAHVDREDNHASGSVVSKPGHLTIHMRLDNPITDQILVTMALPRAYIMRGAGIQDDQVPSSG